MKRVADREPLFSTATSQTEEKPPEVDPEIPSISVLNWIPVGEDALGSDVFPPFDYEALFSETRQSSTSRQNQDSIIQSLDSLGTTIFGNGDRSLSGTNGASTRTQRTSTSHEQISTNERMDDAAMASTTTVHATQPSTTIQSIQQNSEASAGLPCTWAQLKVEFEKSKPHIYTDEVRAAQTIEEGIEAIRRVSSWQNKLFYSATTKNAPVSDGAKRLIACIFLHMLIKMNAQMWTSRHSLLQWFPERLNPEIKEWKGPLLDKLNQLEKHHSGTWIAEEIAAKAATLRNS